MAKAGYGQELCGTERTRGKRRNRHSGKYLGEIDKLDFGIKDLRRIDFHRTTEDIIGLGKATSLVYKTNRKPKFLEIGPGENYVVVENLLEDGYDVAVVDNALPDEELRHRHPGLVMELPDSLKGLRNSENLSFYFGDFLQFKSEGLKRGLHFGVPNLVYSIGAIGHFPGVSTVDDDWGLKSHEEISERFNALNPSAILLLSPRYCNTFNSSRPDGSRGKISLSLIKTEREGQEKFVCEMSRHGWDYQLKTHDITMNEVGDMLDEVSLPRSRVVGDFHTQMAEIMDRFKVFEVDKRIQIFENPTLIDALVLSRKGSLEGRL